MDIILFEGNGYLGEVRKTIPKNFQREKIIIIQGGEDKTNRLALSSKHIDILLDPHLGKRKDFMHHRNSGLNHVLCKLAKKNNIAIGFSFASVLKSKERTKLLGRMIQNIRLCRKYKVKIVIGSFANKESEQRSLKDIQAFFKVLGMTGKEVKADFVAKRLEYKRKYVKRGVRLAE